MQEAVIQLLNETGYTLFKGTAEPKAFIGKDFEDCVIICGYNRAELDSFASDENPKTKAVMQLYSKVVATHDSAFKDTILIIYHQVSSINDLTEGSLRNTILQIEENKYGIRVYVLPYTKNAEVRIAQLQKQATNFTKDLVSELQKDQDSLEVRLENEIYFTIAQLFTKLPFLQVGVLSSGRTMEPLDAQLANAIGSNNTMRDLITARSLEEIIQLSVDDLLNDCSKLEEEKL